MTNRDEPLRFDRNHEFVLQFVERFTELDPLLDERLVEDGKEFLPYLFMGDVARYLISAWTAGSHEIVKAMFDWLEARYEENEGSAVRDLIGAGLVEVLPYAGEEGGDMRGLLGEHLRSDA
jgi:hypothetical protein